MTDDNIMIYRQELHCIRYIKHIDMCICICNVYLWNIRKLSTCDSRTRKQTNPTQWNELFYMHLQYTNEYLNKLNNKVFTLTHSPPAHAFTLMIHCKLISCYANSLFKLLGYSRPVSATLCFTCPTSTGVAYAHILLSIAPTHTH